MKNANLQTERKEKRISFLSVTLVLLMLVTILFWGVSSNWGEVTIKRVYTFAQDGDKISMIVYVPETATDENPAPVVFNFHGRANSTHTLDAWSLEQARRGYVVVNVDRSGCGESLLTQNDDEAAYRYAMALSFTDKENFMATGFSAGTSNAAKLAKNHPENFSAVIQVFPPFFREGASDTGTNTLLCKARGDQYNYENVGDTAAQLALIPANLGLEVEEIEVNKLYGSFEDKTARMFTICENSLHQTAGVSGPAITAMLNFMQDAHAGETYIPGEDHVYWSAQWLALAGCLLMMIFAMALGATLMDHPFFAELKQPMTSNNRGKRGKDIPWHLLTAIGIPLVTFIPVSTFGMDWLSKNVIFPAKNFNGIWVWLIFNVIITLGLMFYNHKKDEKKGEKLVMSDYLLCSEGETKLNGRRIAKGFLLAVIVTAIFYMSLRVLDSYFGVSFQFMTLAALTEVSPERLMKSIPYICVLFVVLCVNGIGMNTSRRVKDSGNPTRDMVKACLINAGVACAAVAILLIAHYGTCFFNEGCGIWHFTEGHSSVGSLNFAFAFPFLMGSMGAINTFYYRKTGTVWTGAFVTAMIAGITAFVAQPLVI